MAHARLASTLVLALAVVALPHKASADDMPKSLVPELLATERAYCQPNGYATGYGMAFIRRQDLTGDGKPELILDWHDVLCGGRHEPYCQGSVCPVRVYVGSGNSWRKVFDGKVSSWGPGSAAGKPALVVDGRALPWTGTTFGP